MGFETPEDILKEYENGLQGAVCNAVDMAKLMEEVPRPLFGSIGNELFGTGKGMLSLPYKAVQYYFPNLEPTGHKQRATAYLMQLAML